MIIFPGSFLNESTAVATGDICRSTTVLCMEKKIVLFLGISFNYLMWEGGIASTIALILKKFVKRPNFDTHSCRVADEAKEPKHLRL